MMYVLFALGGVAWLSLGIVCHKATNDLVEIRLESLSLVFRLFVILLAPFSLLIYERHLFYVKSKPEVIEIKSNEK